MFSAGALARVSGGARPRSGHRTPTDAVSQQALRSAPPRPIQHCMVYIDEAAESEAPLLRVGRSPRGCGSEAGGESAHRAQNTRGLPSGHPCHVTRKVRADVPSLRNARLVRALERSFARGCERGDFRLVHYSLQRDHVHLLVEATGTEALGRGMKATGARLARCVNRIYDRRGPVLADRYHARALRTPREVRAALRYVLLNARRHGGRAVSIDFASSGGGGSTAGPARRPRAPSCRPFPGHTRGCYAGVGGGTV